jgi:hypothetical protein
MRNVAVYALRGGFSGLLCCSPALLCAFGNRDVAALGFLLFVWWLPAVTYGALVTAPLAVARQRPWVAGVVAFLASPAAYAAALWVLTDRDPDRGAPNPCHRLSVTGAVGAAILLLGNPPPARATAIARGLLTVVAGASAALMFCVPEISTASEFIRTVQLTVGFVVWQTATAACLSLGLAGDSKSKTRR